jgi:hypothetical protein
MKDTDPTEQNLQQTYPAVSLAYPIALNSYEWAQKRKEQLDSRAQTLLVLFAGFIFIVPLLIAKRIPAITFRSSWFILAMIAFVAAVVAGIAARMAGALHLLDIRTVHNKMLHMSDWEFQHTVTYNAAQDMRFNHDSLYHKKELTLRMLRLFLVGYALLFVWLVRVL